MIKVLDTFPLIVYFEKEPGFEMIEEDLKKASEGKQKLLMTTVNFGEFCYIIEREQGAKKLAETSHLIESMFPIELVSVDLHLAKGAAQLKAHYKLSYADCFGAALAIREKAQLLTGDPEFKAIESIVNIEWIK